MNKRRFDLEGFIILLISFSPFAIAIIVGLLTKSLSKGIGTFMGIVLLGMIIVLTKVFWDLVFPEVKESTLSIESDEKVRK